MSRVQPRGGTYLQRRLYGKYIDVYRRKEFGIFEIYAASYIQGDTKGATILACSRKQDKNVTVTIMQRQPGVCNVKSAILDICTS